MSMHMGKLHRFRLPAIAAMAIVTATVGCKQNEDLPRELPRTHAEATDFAETGSHAHVVAFLDSLQAAGLDMHRGVLGNTGNGLELPYVVASRPLVTTPHEARRLGRPVVFVQGNIHGGEVEGKEALQALLRDLLVERTPNVLDSIVLVALPIYNADGNDSWAPQAENRGSQNGPEMIGERVNSQRFDLNRDYMKAKAPETRAALDFFREWDPHVLVDLHATNGSYHGYALTYSPSLFPEIPAGEWTRQNILPELRDRVRQRHGFETYDYGNFGATYGADDPTSPEKDGWYTFEHVPRFGTNYYGLRNRVSVLSEAYSHDPFERRVQSTTAFVSELLSLVAERGDALLSAIEEWERESAALAGRDSVPVRGRITSSPRMDSVLVELLERTGDSVRTESGLRPGFRRTGEIVPVYMPVHDRFDAAAWGRVPIGFAVPERDTAAVVLLRRHGIVMEQLENEWRGQVNAFVPDSVVHSPRPFQGHAMVRPLDGRWHVRTVTLPAGTWIVPGSQPLARLATVLLHPASDDGLTTWNYFDDSLAPGRDHPVLFLDTLPGEAQ